MDLMKTAKYKITTSNQSVNLDCKVGDILNVKVLASDGFSHLVVHPARKRGEMDVLELCNERYDGLLVPMDKNSWLNVEYGDKDFKKLLKQNRD